MNRKDRRMMLLSRILSAGAMAVGLLACGGAPTDLTPASLTKLLGDGQVRLPGNELAAPMVVRALDRAQNPQPGVLVSWTVLQGGGTVSSTSDQTDPQGRATAVLRLGNMVGTNTVEALADGVAPVTFEAQAVLAGPIAFVSDRRGGSLEWDVYVMDDDGSNVVPLTSEGNARDRLPAWSPDGTTILFDRIARRDETVWLVLPGLSESSRASDCADGDWSPDGTKIVCTRKIQTQTCVLNPDHNLYVTNANGQGLTQLTFGDCGRGRKHADWSPDGARIAFENEEDISLSGGFGHIWIMDADGSNQVRVTQRQGTYPHWTPDGTHIVFGQFAPLNAVGASLWIINVDGTGEREVWRVLTSLYVIPGGVSPDGTHAVVEVSLRSGSSADIYVVNLESGEAVNVTNRPDGFDGFPAWRW